MANKVLIFGKQYPMYYEQNNTKFKDVASDFFKTQKHFDAKEYYAEVVKHNPEYKSVFYPSEKQIQKMIIEKYGIASVDGATSVPFFEQKYGIKVGGGYKYPNNMSDIEYYFYMLQKLGLGLILNNIKVVDEKSAYIVAWQNLHYVYNDRLKTLQQLYREIIELNPDLKAYKFDTNDSGKLIKFLGGIKNNFPIADIMKFVNGDFEVANTEIYKNKLKSLEKYGIRGGDIQWKLSDETIQNIEQQIQHKKIRQVEMFGNGKSNVVKKAGILRSITSFLGLHKE